MSVQERILIGLTVLGTTGEYTLISQLFGRGASTISVVFAEFSQAVVGNLKSKFMKFPEEHEWQDIVDQFAVRYNVAQCAGAIDGTHVEITVTNDKKQDYWCYKHYHSILTLMICDSNCRVLWLKPGIPGRSNDAGAFRHTDLHNLLQENRIFPRDTRPIRGQEVPFYFMGDGAFRITPFMLKPFPHLTRDPEQLEYNKRHGFARQTTERTFGMVKSRWRRILNCCNIKDEEIVNCAIISAFILHNVCLCLGDESIFELEDNDQDDTDDEEDDEAEVGNGLPAAGVLTRQQEKIKGEAIRNALAAFYVHGN